ncbi:DUF6985 domain-containing protein [Shewanella mangrovisoli]|uniref:DUF6985 domain-containing protein n=1 Tax=Shewanella mangrovisoli TaxID=2864211 RepID=UPI0035B6DA0F
MEVAEKIIDQLELTGHDLEGEISFPALGESVLFTIGLSGSGEIEQSHKDSINWLYNNIELELPKIEEAIFLYYQRVLPDYHLGLGEYADELMPKLSAPNEVWNYVTEPGVFMLPEDEGGELHLEYECTFDVEHGLRVVIKNGKILRVGLE